jgi:hypothetical protein
MATEDQDAYYISKITSIITNDPNRDFSETLDTLSNDWLEDKAVISRFNQVNERIDHFYEMVKYVIKNEENKIRPPRNNRGGGTKRHSTKRHSTKRRTRQRSKRIVKKSSIKHHFRRR